MKHGMHKLLTLLLLLGFVTQPLLQARAISNVTPPCPMHMQQMEHHAMAKQPDCAGHSSQLCADCELCAHSGGALTSSFEMNNLALGVASVIDTYRSLFVSIALSVDSPPPRNL
jgi:hypothetical protein